jgi:hypothetical protein
MEVSSYEYTVTAEDPDEDEVKFSLSSAPEGMTIDSDSGLIRWQISDQQQGGTYNFEVIAIDPEGAQSVQPITLTLTAKEVESGEAGEE